MTALLTDNLPLLAGEPNGIKKLRELILELAVRGKLVPQDPSDEPASELLKRIAKEKTRLVAEGKIKKQKPLPEVDETAQPFELPVDWVWTRLGEITNFGTTTKKDEIPGDAWVLDLEDIEKDTSRLLRKARFYERNSLSNKNSFTKGDVLFGKLRPYLNKVLVAEDDGFCTTEILPFRCHGPFVAHYFMIALKSPYFLSYVNAKSYGMKMPRLGTEDGRQAFFPLPPLAEQHRIVAKVDELMALCDCLEAQQADAENAHAQLVQALLDSLTQASDATDFAANWQRLAEHFHTLFTTEPSIDALKQTLLQLAVMGKLTSSEILSRLQIQDIARLIDGDRGKNYPKSSDYLSEGYCLFLSTKNVRDGCFVFDEKQFISADKHKSLRNGKLERGDVVITTRGTLGNTAWYDDMVPYEEVRINSGMLIIRCYSKVIYQAFLVKYLQSPIFGKQLQDMRTGSAQPQIPVGILKKFLIPIFSIQEQHRIVAKVDQLMALCDQLKTRLTQARQLNLQLAGTMVERVLVKDDQPARVTTDQKAARTLLAAEITHRLHGQRTFGQRKLQKVIYLAEHAARLAAIQGHYLRNVAGPHDRQLMTQVETELQNNEWYERIERETKGHAYRPLSKAGQHRQAYSGTWSATERTTIEQVIELMREWDTDRCEMTVTLYAAWNDFIIEGRPFTDDSIVDEVLHRWNDAKLRFSKSQWLAVLAEMKKRSLLTPSGFGKRTTGGTLTLPGFE